MVFFLINCLYFEDLAVKIRISIRVGYLNPTLYFIAAVDPVFLMIYQSGHFFTLIFLYRYINKRLNLILDDK